MAKVTVLGDCVQIKTELTRAEIIRIQDYEPTALKLYDEKENEIFAVDFGNKGSYSKYGIIFEAEDADEKLFTSIVNPIQRHGSKDAEAKALTRIFAPVLSKLLMVEENVAKMTANIDNIEEDVKSSIIFAD